MGFAGLGLLTNHPFDLAYQAAEDFTAALQQRTRGGGVHEDALAPAHLFQLRLGPIDCRKAAATGTSWRTRTRRPSLAEPLSVLTSTEAGHLRTIIEELSRPEARDPKLAAVTYFPHRASH